jgi:hypothetical protein
VATPQNSTKPGPPSRFLPGLTIADAGERDITSEWKLPVNPMAWKPTNVVFVYVYRQCRSQSGTGRTVFISSPVSPVRLVIGSKWGSRGMSRWSDIELSCASSSHMESKGRKQNDDIYRVSSLLQCRLGNGEARASRRNQRLEFHKAGGASHPSFSRFPRYVPAFDMDPKSDDV